ncbi:MAG: AAA family ATPase, partial [Propionibacteriaceae bacterium]
MTTFATQLQPFADAGILDSTDCYAAQRLGQLSHEMDQRVWLATALLIRALRHGSVCIDLASVAAGPFTHEEHHIDAQDLPWPEPTAWRSALESSVMVTCGDSPTPGPLPLRLVDGLVYMERYWGYQETVRRALLKHSSTTIPIPPHTDAVLDELFPPDNDHGDEPDQQREAAHCALGTGLTVIAGGPGTGKTTTVARLLAALIDTSPRPLHIALAAPTGKAAARLQESIMEQMPRLPDRFHEPLSKLQSSTLHRLLGWRQGSQTRFLHDATNPLPYDVIIVDECSMVALPHMARLVEALAPKTRLVLVGDPFQLSSVDVGAVLADIVAGLPRSVMTLTKTWRFGSTIHQVAEGIRANSIDDVLEGLQPSEVVQWDSDDPALLHHNHHSALHRIVIAQGQEMYQAAKRGEAEAALAALSRHRILCAHRNGAYGAQAWSRTV